MRDNEASLIGNDLDVVKESRTTIVDDRAMASAPAISPGDASVLSNPDSPPVATFVADENIHGGPDDSGSSCNRSLRMDTNEHTASSSSGTADRFSQGKPGRIEPQQKDSLDIGELNRLVDAALARERDERDLIISIWDFAGQHLFYVLHHLFLTSNGVYLVVFNAEELVVADTSSTVSGNALDSDTSSRCLEMIRLWCNSIYVFAPGSPLLLVGTCLDGIGGVSSPVLEQVANVVERGVVQRLPRQLVYSMQRPNAKCPCYFVDNTLQTDGGASIDTLREAVEAIAVAQPSVSQATPVEWLAILDEFGAVVDAGTQRVTIERVRKLAIKCHMGGRDGVSLDDEIGAMLTYFNEVGLVMWFDEGSLRDIVILNPQWLIDAASTIIRDVTGLHPMALDVHARMCHADAWDQFTEDAVLDEVLLPFLWPAKSRAGMELSSACCYTNADRAQLLNLMVKFDLLVKHHAAFNIEHALPDDFSAANSRPGDNLSMSRAWLVPALLPDTAAPSLSSQLQIGHVSTCVLTFDVRETMARRRSKLGSVWSTENLNQGFLPPGLFPRLTSKLIDASLRSGARSRPDARRSSVRAAFGADEFLIEVDHRVSGLRLQIAPRNPVGVLSAIERVVQVAIADFLQRRLDYLVLVPVSSSAYMPLSELRTAQRIPGHAFRLVLDAATGQFKGPLIPATDLFAPDRTPLVSQWLYSTGPLDRYDIYLGYHRNKDRARVERIFSSLQSKTLPFRQGARPDVFVDYARIQAGTQLTTAIVRAVATSTVFAPLISRDFINHLQTPLGQEAPSSRPLESVTEYSHVLLECAAAVELETQRRDALLICPIVMPDSNLCEAARNQILDECSPSMQRALVSAFTSLGLATPQARSVRAIFDAILGHARTEAGHKHTISRGSETTSTIEARCSDALLFDVMGAIEAGGSAEIGELSLTEYRRISGKGELSLTENRRISGKAVGDKGRFGLKTMPVQMAIELSPLSSHFTGGNPADWIDWLMSPKSMQSTFDAILREIEASDASTINSAADAVGVLLKQWVRTRIKSKLSRDENTFMAQQSLCERLAPVQRFLNGYVAALLAACSLHILHEDRVLYRLSQILVAPAIELIKTELDVLRANVANGQASMLATNLAGWLSEMNGDTFALYELTFKKTIYGQRANEHGDSRLACDAATALEALAQSITGNESRQATGGLLQLLLKVRAVLPRFEELMNGITRSLKDITLQMRPGMKGIYRTVEKASLRGTNFTESDADCSGVLDIGGCFVVCHTYQAMAETLKHIKAAHFNLELIVTRVKNRCIQPCASGWRDVLVNVSLDGVTLEIQLIHQKFYLASTEIAGPEICGKIRFFQDVLLSAAFSSESSDPPIQGPNKYAERRGNKGRARRRRASSGDPEQISLVDAAVAAAKAPRGDSGAAVFADFELVLQHQQDVNSMHRGKSALHAVVALLGAPRQVEVVDTILDNRADLEQIDSNGQTALERATAAGNKAVAQQLTERSLMVAATARI